MPLLVKMKWIKTFTGKDKLIKNLYSMWNKRVTHIQPITFLKRETLDRCLLR
jgi:hypothetical protein